MSDELDEDVEVLYDYEYSDDSGPIQIKTGDIYKLIEKTNSEWWQVDDLSDANGQPFFVPAHYVKIVSEKSPRRVDFDSDRPSGFGNSSDTTKDNTDIVGVESSDFRQPQSVTSETESDKHDINKNIEYTNAVKTGNGSDYANLTQYRDAAGIPGQVCIFVDKMLTAVDIYYFHIIISSYSPSSLPLQSNEFYIARQRNKI